MRTRVEVWRLPFKKLCLEGDRSMVEWGDAKDQEEEATTLSRARSW